jgi:O-methyltransferase involved in polyketide biosynthesis
VKPADPGKESMANWFTSRTAFFDQLVGENVDQMDQMVLLGAGFDSRAFKYCQGKAIKVFELDEEQT